MYYRFLLGVCLLTTFSEGQQWHRNLTKEFQIVKGKFDCYGDITKLTPKGRRIGGIAASRHFLDVYLNRANRSCFVTVGERNCIHPAIIAGVASRESGFGFFLSKDGYSKNREDYGMMQCDIPACPVCRYGYKCTTYRFDSCEHVQMMTEFVLVKYILAVKNKMPDWRPEMQIQGGVAAYNFGVSNVKSWANLDVGTTGGDYSNDIIAQAQWLIQHYGW